MDPPASHEGTLHPVGSLRVPSNNAYDAWLIAQNRGVNKIKVYGDELLLDQNIDFSGFIFSGQAHINNSLELSSAVGVSRTVFTNLTISGVLDGDNEINNCIVRDMQYVNGHIHSCGLIGSVILGGDKDAVIADCFTVDPYVPPIIDMGGEGQNLSMPNYSGLLTIKNSFNNFIGVGLLSGEVVLENTVTSGVIHISGNGRLVDVNGDEINTGTWNGGVIIINTLSSGVKNFDSSSIANAVWNGEINEAIQNTYGETVQYLKTWLNYLRRKG